MHQRDELRKRLTKQRRQLTSAQQKAAAAHLLTRFQTWFEQYDGAKQKPNLTIAGYLAFGGEIDIAPIFSLLRDLGHNTVVPIIRPEQQGRLLFAPISTSSKMTLGAFNIRIPEFQNGELLTANSLDLVLVPLVGVDKVGNRLGMGGGYYDKTFSDKLSPLKKNTSPVLVGVCHSLQILESLPAADWDVPLDAVISDKAVIK